MNKRIFLLPAIVFVLFSCSLLNPQGKNENNKSNSGNVNTKDTGSITVCIPGLGRSLSGISKTVVPDFTNEADTFRIVLTSHNGFATISNSISASTNLITISNIEVGTWDIWVTATLSGSVTGTGVLSNQVITANTTLNISIPIIFSQSGGTGNIYLTVQFPVSAGINYISGTITGTSSSNLTPAIKVCPTNTNYNQATFGATNIKSGINNLVMTFMRGGPSGTVAGVFGEAVNIWNNVTSDQWIDQNGNLQQVRVFSAGEFYSSNANLSGLAISAGTNTIAFGSSITNYNAGAVIISNVTITPAQSVAGQFIQYNINNGNYSTIKSGNTSGNLTLLSGINNISVKVTAPDKVTVKSYNIGIAMLDGVYVATNGMDSNSGSRSSPIKSIQFALKLASEYGLNNIRITAGTYLPGSGLNNNGNCGLIISNSSNLNISGGWDQVFSNQTGISILNVNKGQYSTINYHVIIMTNVYNVTLNSFQITGGYADSMDQTGGADSFDNNGGGILMINVTGSLITNCTISNNFAGCSSGKSTNYGSGGGLYLLNSSYNTINANIFFNSADFGAGLELDYSIYNNINGNISNNEAPIGAFGGSNPWVEYSAGEGGGLYLYCSSNNTISGSVCCNGAYSLAGGIEFDTSANNNISTAVFSNTVLNMGSGGGLEFDNSSYNTVSGNIYSNSGVGIDLDNSGNNTITGSIFNNGDEFGGGVEIVFSINNTFSGDIHNNKAGWGGGLFIENSCNNQITGNIYSNSVYGAGGGVLLEYASNNTISGDVYGNSDYANGSFPSGGGGLYIGDSGNNTISGDVFSNYSDNNGGGLSIARSSSDTISGHVYNNTSYRAGGLYFDSCISENIIHDITGNYAGLGGGGGVYFYHMTNYTLNIGIYSNSAVNGGGGIYIDSSGCNIINSIIMSNYSERLGGGGVYIITSSSNTISSNVSGNSSASLYGGGVYLGSSYFNTISGSVIGNNGGGLYLYNSISNIITGKVSCNTNIGSGGGLWLAQYSEYNTISSPILSNISASNGGGLYLNLSGYNNITSTLSGNNAGIMGGGICIDAEGYNSINGIISNNSAVMGGGIAITDYSYYSTIYGSGVVTCNSNWGIYYDSSSKLGTIYGSVINNMPGNITNY